MDTIEIKKNLKIYGSQVKLHGIYGKNKNEFRKNFWVNKKVLITGHTGFKGSWLSLWLLKNGANVYGYSLPVNEMILYNSLKLENLNKSSPNLLKVMVIFLIRNF